MEKTYAGSCHCGKVKFELTADIDHVRVCDCSICRKRGALIYRAPEEALNILTPLEDMTLYKWGSMTAEDYFCPDCGILTFRKPSMPTPGEIERGLKPFYGWAINVRCIDAFDIFHVEQKRIYRADVPASEIIAREDGP